MQKHKRVIKAVLVLLGLLGFAGYMAHSDLTLDGVLEAYTTTGSINLDDGTGASPSLILTDATNETLTISKTDSSHATFTITAADAIQVLTGNLRVGNGTPGQTHNGEDFYVEGISEFAGNVTIDKGATNSPTVTFIDGQDETAVLVKANGADLTCTIADTTESLRIVTGNFRVGDGTADVALDGEDAYVEDTLEVDGLLRLDGTLDANWTANIQGALTLQSSLIRTSQEYIINGGGKPGATKGWVTTGTVVNLFNYTLPASTATTATMVIPISGLHVGDTITGFKLVGQIESAGGIVEMDAALRKLTTVAAATTDALVGAIAPIHVVADTAVASAKTGLAEVVAATETFYVLISATTAASTDIDIQGVTVTVTTN